VACSLINTTPDGEQFSFCAHDIDHMIESFGDGFIMDVHIRYGSSNIIFDASIYDDESMQKNIQGFDSQIVKLLNTYEWKEKQLGKMSITLQPGAKKGNTSLNLLSMLTNGPLTKLHWHLVRSPSKDKC